MKNLSSFYVFPIQFAEINYFENESKIYEIRSKKEFSESKIYASESKKEFADSKK